MYLFLKSQVVSITATTVDFLLTLLMKEIVGLAYLPAHIAGLTSGGFTQFILNRNWTFKEKNKKNKEVILRFATIWILGFLINVSTVWILTAFLQWNYIVSKIITSLILAVTFNFYLQKKYVFN